MHTQITCPNCQTPYTAEVHQVIDAGRNPELKQRLINGQLNMAVCPNCGAGGQIRTPLLFHDPEHELFMIYVPQELNLGQVEREQLIGDMAREVMDSLAPEQRRAYMLQPQQVLSMQTFMENVLETEGITKEMIARQRKQAELLNTLLNADKDVVDHLIKERSDEIDETFFAMLQSYLDAANQMQDNQQLVKMTNLRAKLMTETDVGRRIEKQQMALHSLNRDVKKEGSLTPKMLLEHLLKHAGDEGVEMALATAGRTALSYQFFQMLSNEIEKKEKAGDREAAQRLTGMRERLLKFFEEMRQESERMLETAENLLQTFLDADDKQAAIREHMNEIDDAFMYLLTARIAQADQQNNQAMANTLSKIHALIVQEAESQYPPEVILLNKLLEAPDKAQQEKILDENAELVSEELVQMLDAVSNELQGAGQDELNGRLQTVKSMVQARLLVG